MRILSRTPKNVQVDDKVHPFRSARKMSYASHTCYNNEDALSNPANEMTKWRSHGVPLACFNHRRTCFSKRWLRNVVHKIFWTAAIFSESRMRSDIRLLLD